MSQTLHVSICGGGIAGLALAVILGKYGSLPVEVFESGPTITTFGAGIVFYQRTVDIMKDLGLYDQIVEVSTGPPTENACLMFRKSDQQDGYHWFSKSLKSGVLLMHRKDLIEFLVRNVPASCKIHTSKKLEFYDVDPQTGKITLHFVDGSSTVTDVLVGADGIRSATRRAMYQRLASSIPDDDSRQSLINLSQPVWTGMLVYRNLVPSAKFAKEYPNIEVSPHLTLHLGKDRHVVMFPVSQGELINIVMFCHDPDAFGKPYEGRWVLNVSEKEVPNRFEDWDICVKAIVKCVENPSRWALHSLRPLPHYVHERVALIGDAAHAMEPHFGAGAGQAIEDALVLGRLLTHELTHRGNVADVLKVYEQVRLPFANAVLQRTHEIGCYYGLQFKQRNDLADSPLPTRTYATSPEELLHVSKSIEELWEWQNEPVRIWEDADERWRAACSGGNGGSIPSSES